MLAGELYRTDEPNLADQAAAKAWMVRYNAALARRRRNGANDSRERFGVSARAR